MLGVDWVQRRAVLSKPNQEYVFEVMCCGPQLLVDCVESIRNFKKANTRDMLMRDGSESPITTRKTF